MKLTWLGHGSFRLESNETIILIDPWLNGNPMLPEDQHDAATKGATHILLTHAHFDHAADVVDLARKMDIPMVGQFDLMSYWADSEKIETVGFNKGGTVDVGGISVSMVRADHSSTLASDDGPKAAGSEVGYMIRAEGRVIYFSGDTDIMADMGWFGEYYQPDIGILSAGGHFTMDMKAAAWAAKKYFDFKTVIPMHYRTFPLLAQDAKDLRAGLPGVDVIEPEVMSAIEL